MGDHGMTDEGEHGETSKTNTVSPFLHILFFSIVGILYVL
jgi:hypothetical protein